MVVIRNGSFAQSFSSSRPRSCRVKGRSIGQGPTECCLEWFFAPSSGQKPSNPFFKHHLLNAAQTLYPN